MHISEIMNNYSESLAAINLYFDEGLIGAPDDMMDCWWRVVQIQNKDFLEFDYEPFGEDIDPLYREEATVVSEKKDFTLVRIFSYGCSGILDNHRRIP